VSAPADVRGLRVLFVLYYYSPYTSGLTLATRAYAEGLAARGAHVAVLCGLHEPELPRREVIDGVRVLRVPPAARIDKGLVLPGLVPAARRLGRRADVVIPVMPLLEAGVISRMLPRGRVLPFHVCDLRLADRPVSKLIERAAAREARAAVRRSGRFLALSEDYAAASRVVGDLAGGAVGVAPPVDPGPFHPVDPAPLRARLGLPPGPVVGFVGRLVPEKGLPVLLEAMRAVRRAHPGARLVIAGEGRSVAGGGIADDLEAAAHGEDWVTFTGFLPQEDLPAFYAMCDVLALPSIDPLEAYGIVQVEAMLCGTPVVASDMPGVRIPVGLTGMGRLAPPGDAEGLAARLGEVLADPAAFAVARERVAELLSPGIPLDALATAVAAAAAAAGPRR